MFFFGSRVTRENTARSDYDVGIEAAGSVPLIALGEMKDTLADLPILQKIDLVDFANVSEDFKAVAKQNIEVIYEQ